MPDPSKPAHVSFDFSFQKGAQRQPASVDASLRIAILAHFGGGGNGARVIQIDCDNFDSACAQFAASVKLPKATLAFTSLNDFHPDRLLQKVPVLARMLELRAQLVAPGGADGAAAEVQALLHSSPLAQASAQPAAESSDDMLVRLLGRSPSAVPVPASPSSIVEQLAKQAVGSSVVPTPGVEQRVLLPLLEAKIANQLRAILHHPDFQEIESAWRGLDFLVREAGENVELHVMDITREQLVLQLAASENPAATAIGRQIERIAPAVILGAFSFGASDAPALARIGRLAATFDTAFIGGAKSELAGCASFSDQPNPIDWANAPDAGFSELRRAAEARHIGLALPRFIIRHPYGRGSDEIETLPFEELPASDAHEAYLWANPAFLCGHRLITAFAETGWELDGTGGRTGGLPVHTFVADGEKQTKPCAEVSLSDKAGDAILDRGLMPVLSVRGSDSVLLVCIRSIAAPSAPLAIRLG